MLENPLFLKILLKHLSKFLIYIALVKKYLSTEQNGDIGEAILRSFFCTHICLKLHK